ncbi:iron-containing redox enzyme family protein [Fischerella sp. JS2]|uniref:iron-containing redox enzyme family protein n=1 Tax=Fischerella sp. JS2 TaxID=2597771 RepID=UPI0028E9AC95|nr:iron-containing redox enzyme family protein [Fischerella sp. JS2]
MIETTNKLTELVKVIIAEEEAILDQLDVELRLCKATANAEGLKQFAEVFYFIRYDFPRLNFVVGERCGTNEFLWAGLAKNLIEELGGKNGPSHNQLYRDFLSSVGTKSEELLKEPLFAQQFNANWENFCRTASLEEALCAIAVYEIFDQPDYQLFLRVMQEAGVPEYGLRFFRVHAAAEHFEMFEDVVAWLQEQEGGKEAFAKGKDFVVQTQRKMWNGLMECLEKQCLTCPV